MESESAVIAAHVDEALRSPLFVKADRQARFLRFVVTAALQSPAPLVREFDIAREVYDRRADYDPRVDPIVRVEAARLRARLREYYEGSPPLRVRIDLPKGRYLPQFTFVMADRSVQRTGRTGETTVLVLPFKTLSSAGDAGFSEGLAEECIHDLTRLPAVRVVLAPEAGPWTPPASAHLRLEATVRRDGAEVRVTLRLVDPADGVTIASSLHAATVVDLFAAQDGLARQMARDVAEALSALNQPQTGSSDRASE